MNKRQQKGWNTTTMNQAMSHLLAETGDQSQLHNSYKSVSRWSLRVSKMKLKFSHDAVKIA